MLIIFTVNDQKVTHDLGQRTLVAGSSGVVKGCIHIRQFVGRT